jgi:FAD/FMN-containing dehydrogenase
VILGVDPDPAKADELKSWVVGYSEAVQPYSTEGGGGYVNFMGEGSEYRVRTAYRDNYDRLAEVKRTYDPDNVFHVNWNIPSA